MPAVILFQYLRLDPIKNLGLWYPLKQGLGSCIQESWPWKPLPVAVDTWDSVGFRNFSFSGQKYPEAFLDVVLHILSLVLALFGLPEWKQSAGPRLVGGVSARLTPSVVVMVGACLLHSGPAVTSPVAEAPPASSEPVPDALLPLGMLGGVWDRQTLCFAFWSRATRQWRVRGFGLHSLVVSPSGQLLNEPHHGTAELSSSLHTFPGQEDLALLSPQQQSFRSQWPKALAPCCCSLVIKVLCPEMETWLLNVLQA